jgi:hypothetical protein
MKKKKEKRKLGEKKSKTNREKNMEYPLNEP